MILAANAQNNNNFHSAISICCYIHLIINIMRHHRSCTENTYEYWEMSWKKKKKKAAIKISTAQLLTNSVSRFGVTCQLAVWENAQAEYARKIHFSLLFDAKRTLFPIDGMDQSEIAEHSPSGWCLPTQSVQNEWLFLASGTIFRIYFAYSSLRPSLDPSSLILHRFPAYSDEICRTGVFFFRFVLSRHKSRPFFSRVWFPKRSIFHLFALFTNIRFFFFVQIHSNFKRR